MSSSLSFRSAAVLALTLGCVAAVALRAAAAQQGKQPTQRIVEGIVQSKDGQPQKGVVVFLEDEKTLFIKSYLTDDEGHFKFSQLSLATDYDLWAENAQSGIHSKTKHISPFNDKPDLNYTLKLD